MAIDLRRKEIDNIGICKMQVFLNLILKSDSLEDTFGEIQAKRQRKVEKKVDPRFRLV